MKMTKTLLAAALTLPLMVATSGAFAGDGHGKRDHERRGHEGRDACGPMALMHQVELTDDQKSQMKALHETHRDAMKAQRGEKSDERKEARMTEREAVQKLVMADKFDRKAAQKVAQERAEAQAEFMVLKLERQHEMFSILTPEQKEKFAELQQERGKDCRKSMPRHGHKGE